MTENLALKLTKSTTLTNVNTNLVTKSSWTPTHNYIISPGETDQDASNDHSYYVGGNYGALYNTRAATAGSTPLPSAGDAANSICPKGWRLPSGDLSVSSAADKSFAKLSQSYGVTYQLGSMFGYTMLDATNYSGWLSDLPVSITYAGLYRWTEAGYYEQGSSTNFQLTRDTATLYHYVFGVSNGEILIYAAFGFDGYSVRCVNL